MKQKKIIAVIGAGMAGLLAMKSLREEGLEFVCFESTDYYGGLWKYHENDTEGVASVMKTTIINTSKELGAVSDFPPPASFPNYMHHELMYQYLSMIAQKIDAQRYIKFNHKVTSITQAEDYQQTGRWVVTVEDTRNKVTSNTTFDGVIVCTGHHIFPNMPSFPGMEDFEGTIMHSRSLKKVNAFEDQRVLVVGVGNSGVDAAVEISNVAKQKITEVDAVILATGYQIKFPFLSENILRVENNWVKLYKYVYPPNLPHPTLAVISLIQPNGPGLPVGEMQCRWVAMVLNGKCSLPSKDEMLCDILKNENSLRKTFVNSPRHTLQADFIDYQDELAAVIGVKPNFWKIALTDPKLFKACITGPSLPYQYRLQGPHTWKGARDAILTYNDRVKAPFLKPGDKQTAKGGKHFRTDLTWIQMMIPLLLISWYLNSVFIQAS